jgi:hypothetical protein
MRKLRRTFMIQSIGVAALALVNMLVVRFSAVCATANAISGDGRTPYVGKRNRSDYSSFEP